MKGLSETKVLLRAKDSPLDDSLSLSDDVRLLSWRVGMACTYVFLLESVGHLTSALQLPFLRTSVVCSTPTTAESWSGSLACGDASAVLQVAQLREGEAMSCALLAHMIVTPLLAVVADTHGRTFVLVISTFLKMSRVTIVLLLSFATPTVHFTIGRTGAFSAIPLPLFMCASFLGGAGATNIPLNALVGDFSHRSRRGTTFTALTLAHAGSGLASSLCAAMVVSAQTLRNTFSRVYFLGVITPEPSRQIENELTQRLVCR